MLGRRVSAEPQQSRGRDLAGRRLPWDAALLLLVIAGCAQKSPVAGPQDSEALLKQARAALRQDAPQQAEEILRQVLALDPKHAEGLLLAGEAALQQKRPDRAQDYYQSLQNAAVSVEQLLESSDRLMKQHQLSAAEALLRRVLTIDAGQYQAHANLAFSLVVQGRTWEARPHLLELVRQKQFSIQQLFLLASPEQVVDYSNLLQQAEEVAPHDAAPVAGLAWLALQTGDRDAAAHLARKAIARDRCNVPAQVVRGQLLTSDGLPFEIAVWNRRLPPEANEYPDVWYVRGACAERFELTQAAMRCYWETLRRAPDHAAANYRLAHLLRADGQQEKARMLEERARLLEDLGRTLRPIYTSGPDLDRMLRAAEVLESLGRLWEAWAWCHAAAMQFAEAVEPRRRSARLALALADKPPPILDDRRPALLVDLGQLPLPDWRSVRHRPRQKIRTPAVQNHIAFEEVSRQSQIHFQYCSGDDPATPGTGIYQEFGGGIAVLDYDDDGWPDLYLSQGCLWPLDPKQTEFTDRLYRNLGDGRFADVTEQAGLGDNQYSQGVSAGDVDNDGFPDLVVCNIGVTRLYRNQGDGTFRDVTETCGLSGHRWTTSSLLADLNGDSWPDLYEVNYLTGKEPFMRVCGSRHRPRACMPVLFPAEQDRLYLNLADGWFEDHTERAGIVAPGGKGLGIVAADFDGNSQLDLFLANDMTPNFYFVNETAARGQPPRFSERGLQSGLALDNVGRSQACMGIAIDDADHDGFFDLLVTNFYEEANAFYKQQSAALFSDTVQTVGLAPASFHQLGFGTQFLDADLDGWPDLVVANGHVDDYTHNNIPYRMRPQFFLNLQGSGFRELDSPELGAYFTGTYLGRSLARLDFDRNGREDFAVMHLDAPLALLANRSRSENHFLSVSLQGNMSGRDAIGARVELTVAGKWRVRQLTAGDGFQACNERRLIFGLGQDKEIEQLKVRWPSGLEQSFKNIRADQEILLVEGRDEIIVRRR